MSCTPQGTPTPVLGLCKPQAGETNWTTAINGNFDLLDSIISTMTSNGAGIGMNLLPNTQWQVMNALGPVTKMASSGVSTAPAISVASYTVGLNTVQCNATNTGELHVNDLVTFAAPADPNLTICSLRVDALTVNTSFLVSLPLGLGCAVSTASTAVIITRGDLTGSSGDAADNWSKTLTLSCWRDDYVVNNQPGSRYQLGLQKTVGTTESLYYAVPSRDLEKFQGRTVVFGCWVYQKIRGGSNTWKLGIYNGTAWTYSGVGATTAVYQWLEVSATVPTSSNQVQFNIDTLGNSGDTYYVSQPMAVFGTFLSVGQYAQPLREIIVPKVKMSPLSWIGAAPTFSASTNSGGDYGFVFRPFPETNGAIAPTVRELSMQTEGKNGLGTNRALGVRSQAAPPVVYGTLMYASVVAQFMTAHGMVTLADNGDAFVYSNTASDAWNTVSFDINIVIA